MYNVYLGEISRFPGNDQNINLKKYNLLIYREKKNLSKRYKGY